jgi:VanZ family protein
MASIFFSRAYFSKKRDLRGWQRAAFVWTPVLLGVGVIAIESTATFSAANTSSWLRPIAEAIFGRLSDPTWEEAHHLLRKSGHFLGYGTLCVLFLRAWLLTLAEVRRLNDASWRLSSWVRAIASTAFIASCDEIHQSFLPSRTGMFSDVVLDTIGATIVSGLVLAAAWKRHEVRQGQGVGDRV